MTHRIWSALTILFLLSATNAFAEITWQFNYSDSGGVGFNAPGSLGLARKQAVAESSAIVSNILNAYTATIIMDVRGDQTNNNFLASATSNINTPFVAGFGNRGDVGRKILGEADPAPAAADGTIDWNFEDFTWDLDDNVSPTAFDFQSTMAHELLHAVGFSSNIGENGNDLNGSGNAWGPFDQFVADSIDRLINPTAFVLNTRWSIASIGGTGTVPPGNGLYFNGPNANAANGGNPVPIYSPNPWDGGNGSHTDDNYFNGSNPPLLLMNIASDPGPGIRGISEIELGILKDIGFTNAVIPEPTTFCLMAFALIFGASLQRRR